MRAAGGNRLPWASVPPDVRAAVERALGARIVEAVNQPGGFSPGTAARCRLADGERVFVKAVSPAQNEHACRIHRREAEIASKLPEWVPAPRLRHVVDDGRWVVLVLDDVEGRTPSEPWALADLDVVMPAVLDLVDRLTPTPVDDLQAVGDKQREAFAGWRRLASGDGDVTAIDPWARVHLEDLARLEAGWEAAGTGSTLLHTDLRADNVLVTDRGAVTFVDWPWACVGAGFLDPLFMLPSIGLGGGPPPEEVVERYGLFADVDGEALTAVLSALTGFLVRASLDPPPPGLPTVRRFQAAQGAVALAWLRRRT